MSTTSTGLLSQAIKNLKAMGAQIKALANLPADAATIKTSALNVFQGEITTIEGIQTKVAQFASASLPQLEQAKTDLENNTNLDQVETIIKNLNTSSTGLKTAVDASVTTINSNKDQVVKLTHALVPIGTQLNNQNITLHTQLQSAQQEAAAIRSKEKYFLALGILGLVGLAGAAIALKVQEDKVNGLLAQASKLGQEIANLEILIKSVKTMTTDFMGIINKMSTIKNAVDFVSSDIGEIVNDLKNTQGGQSKAKLYIIATISQLNTLAGDAS